MLGKFPNPGSRRRNFNAKLPNLLPSSEMPSVHLKGEHVPKTVANFEALCKFPGRSFRVFSAFRVQSQELQRCGCAIHARLEAQRLELCGWKFKLHCIMDALGMRELRRIRDGEA